MSEIPEDIADESTDQLCVYDNDFEEDIEEDVEEVWSINISLVIQIEYLYFVFQIISVAKDVCRIKEGDSDEDDQVIVGDKDKMTYSILHE